MKKLPADKIIQRVLSDSHDDTALEILSQYYETKDKFHNSNIQNTITIFGSARIKSPTEAKHLYNTSPTEENKNILEASQYYQQAYDLSYKLSTWIIKNKLNITIGTGAGGGIMEAANKGAFDTNSKTIGFNITLPFEQTSNPYVSPELLINFKHFFIRKYWMTKLCRAFVVFPGGFGTIDELYELLTLCQTKKIKQIPPIVLFGTDFFTNLVNHDILTQYKLISPSDNTLFIKTDSIDVAFNHIIDNINIV